MINELEDVHGRALDVHIILVNYHIIEFAAFNQIA